MPHPEYGIPSKGFMHLFIITSEMTMMMKFLVSD